MIGSLQLGTSTGWASVAVPLLMSPQTPVSLTVAQLSFVASADYLGTLVSCIPSCYLMDAIGRRATLRYLNLFSIASWVFTYYATTPLWLYFARFSAGLWMGTCYTVMPIYLTEITETNLRASLGTCFSTLFFAGLLLILSVGPFIPYNVMVIACGLIPVFYSLMLFAIPESPYFYGMQGDHQAAAESLARLRSSSVTQVQAEVLSISNSIAEQNKTKMSLCDVIRHRGLRKALAIVLSLTLFQRFSGISGLMSYSSTTLPNLQYLSADHCVIIFGSVLFLSCLSASFFLDMLKRRTFLAISSLGCSLSISCAAVWFHLDYLFKESTWNKTIDQFNWVPLVSLAVFSVFYSVGSSSIVHVLKSELFPANIKAISSGVGTVTFAIGSYIVNQSYLQVAQYYGVHVCFYVFAASSLIILYLTCTIMIETKGRTLQEIQDELNKTA